MSSENYLSKEAKNTNSVLYNTLKSVFENVIIIQGSRNFYVASDKALSHKIVEQLNKKGIENDYLNQYYIDEQLLISRSEYILGSLDKDVQVNKDFKPIAYYRELLFWTSHFKFNYWMPAVVLLLLIIFLLLRLNPVNLGLFASGFSASSIEVILLISFQIVYGYVYQITGIIITLFMAGLALGSLFLYKVIKVSIANYIKLQICLAFYTLAIPYILWGMTLINIPNWVVHLVFLFITADIAALIGIQFTFATKLQKKGISSIASESYSTDLVGSAIGALIVSAFLIPLLGLLNVGIVLGVLNAIVGAIIFIRRKNYLSL